MCLQTTWKKSKIAKKDIVVYKVLRKGTFVIKSPYNNFYWELEKEYFTDIIKTEDITAYDVESQEKLWELKTEKGCDSFISIGPGFHSALNKNRLSINKHNEECLFKCIIPKGSEYYIGLTDLVVSNRIIIKEKI